VDNNCRHIGSPTESMTRSLHIQLRAKSQATTEALVAPQGLIREQPIPLIVVLGPRTTHMVFCALGGGSSA
jgi:hypothetical protein